MTFACCAKFRVYYYSGCSLLTSNTATQHTLIPTRTFHTPSQQQDHNITHLCTHTNVVSFHLSSHPLHLPHHKHTIIRLHDVITAANQYSSVIFFTNSFSPLFCLSNACIRLVLFFNCFCKSSTCIRKSPLITQR